MSKQREITRALITGITGTGGSQLAEYLAQNQRQVEIHGTSRAYQTAPSQNLEQIASQVTLHRCDLLDFSSILSVLKEVKPDAVFNMASYAEVQGSFKMPLFVTGNNVMANANLLEAIREAEISPFVLLTSTPEVYGNHPKESMPITENHQTNPPNPYAASKLHQEKLALIYHETHGMKNIVTRMFSYINPRRKDLFSTSFAMQVARIEQGLQSELTHGNLDSTRTLIDVRDAMSAYWQAITKCTPGEVYNISGSTVKSVGEFLDVLKNLAKTTIPSHPDPQLFRPTDTTRQIVDSSKFQQATGWTPEYTFKQTVEYLLDHCREEVKKQVK
tara:strand:- start:1768 stop:2760 length:993 start_codon:yes stop_codon:yes gene_type:complete